MYCETSFDLDPELKRLFDASRDLERDNLLRIDNKLKYNFMKVLRAFRSAGISDQDFAGATGYGYDDRGREVTEEVYAKVFGTESALVRQQIASGTQALSLCLFGLLLPGDEILFATGKPYDTLQTVVGMDKHIPGCLAELGITWQVVSKAERGDFDAESIANSVTGRTKVVFIQRSRGYFGTVCVMQDDL